MDNESEEFEFKPLTDGLGFHKKTLDLKDDFGNLPLQTGILPKARAKISQAFQSSPQRDSRINPSIEKRPLPPAKPLHKDVRPLGWAPALDKKVDFTESMSSQIAGRSIVMDWSSAIFDFTMSAGLSLLFIASLVFMTQLGLDSLVKMVLEETGARLALGILVLSVAEIYILTARSFFGQTLGEWAFGFRLGTPEDQTRSFYPILVVWRSLLLIFTGVVTLPIISYLIDRDLVGMLSGLYLYEEQ